MGVHNTVYGVNTIAIHYEDYDFKVDDVVMLSHSQAMFYTINNWIVPYGATLMYKTKDKQLASVEIHTKDGAVYRVHKYKFFGDNPQTYNEFNYEQHLTKYLPTAQKLRAMSITELAKHPEFLEALAYGS